MTLPVKGSGGGEIRLAPGPDGRLWVSIPSKGGMVVALLDGTGKPSPGWPVLLHGVDGCDKLLPVSDATLRIVCSVSSHDGLARAFSYDANGEPRAGWPVDIADGSAGSLHGERARAAGRSPPPHWRGGWSTVACRGRVDPTRRDAAEGPRGPVRVLRQRLDDRSRWRRVRHDSAGFGSTAANSKTDVVAFGPDGSAKDGRSRSMAPRRTSRSMPPGMRTRLSLLRMADRPESSSSTQLGRCCLRVRPGTRSSQPVRGMAPAMTSPVPRSSLTTGPRSSSIPRPTERQSLALIRPANRYRVGCTDPGT